jgi:hypothetical protein
MLQVGTRVMLTGVIERVDVNCTQNMPYEVRLDDHQLLWFGDDVCKPLEAVESANLQPPTNAAQNAQSGTSGDPAAAGA